MMKLYKIMFFNLMILGSLIAISSYSWLSMWMGLEINLLSVIPLFNTKDPLSSESSMKYFISQALASSILLFSIITTMMLTENLILNLNFNMNLIMDSAFLMKMGAAPLHFWFPEVMEGLNWMNALILLTWQKIAPMILLMNNNFNNKFMILAIIMGLIISVTLSLNQVSLRKILTFSSINHISWMLTSMLISKSIWSIYFITYSFLNINMILLFFYTNCYYMSQIFNMLNNNKILKITFIINFLSLGGIPPFLGFLPKWFTINWMIFNYNYMMTFMLIMMTLIFLYIYMRIMFSSMIIMTNEYKFINMNINTINKLYIYNMMMILSLILSTMMFNLY